MSARYEYIDLDNISEIADGEREFIEEIVNNYLRTYPGYLDEMDSALQSGNHEKIFFCAHKLKGSFSFIGSAKLASLAEQIEDRCKDKGDISGFLPLFSEMKTLAEKAKSELGLALAALE